MNQARDILGVLIIFSVAYSVFANQVMLSELAGDARSVMTFSDHVSMSVDLFFSVFIRLIGAVLIVLLSGLFFQGVLLAGRSVVSGIHRLRSKLKLEDIARRPLTFFGEPSSSRHFANSQEIPDASGRLTRIEYKIKPSGSIVYRLYAIAWLLISIFLFNSVIEATSKNAATDVWASPASLSGSLLLLGAYLFLSLYLFVVTMWARVSIFIDDGKDGQVTKDDIAKQFGIEGCDRIFAGADRHQSEFRSNVSRSVAAVFLTIYLPFAAYAHGLSLANSYYFRMLQLEPAGAEVAEKPGGAAVAIEMPTSVDTDGKLLIRAIDQGVLLFDAGMEHLVFVNDENTISARFRLKHRGPAEIGRRPSCPLGVADEDMFAVLFYLYFLDNLPVVGDGFKLGPCPRLAVLRDAERAKAVMRPAKPAT